MSKYLGIRKSTNLFFSRAISFFLSFSTFFSSAPEDPKHVTLHIRAVGQWTNRLYDYVENMKKKEVTISRANSKKERKSLKNGLRKRSTIANIPLPKSQEAEKQEVDRSNSAPNKSGQTVRYADSHIVDLTIDNNKISKLLVLYYYFFKNELYCIIFSIL